MKMIAAPAMSAIEAGEAIVTGAVKILPALTVAWDVVQTVDIDAVANAGGATSDGLAVGIELTGFLPSDVLRLTMPGGGTFIAWNYQDDGTANRWVNEFDIIPERVVANSFRVSQEGITPSSGTHFPNGYASAALAIAAFGSHQITGADNYTFYIVDTATGGGSGTFNNSGGVSVLVEKRRIVAGGGDPIRLWGGYGPITLDGEVYEPLGDYAFAQQSAGAIGGVAQGLTLGVSGIEPAALELLDADEVKGASVVIRRLIFASDGKTLLDHGVWDRGRGDTVATDEVIGGAAAIALAIESAARGLGHSGARMRADSDQRLISATDGYFKNTAFAGQKELYWGGKKPVRTGSAVGGTTAVAGSAGGTGAGF